MEVSKAEEPSASSGEDSIQQTHLIKCKDKFETLLRYLLLVEIVGGTANIRNDYSADYSLRLVKVG
jgi:hypothetical protein